MNNGLLLMSICVLLACNNNTQTVVGEENSAIQTSVTPKNTPTENSDNSWQQNFKSLKQAIVTGNREEVKTFINFPISNKGNEIWYLADPELVMEISPKTVKPFTSNDFDKYFSALYGIDFRKTLENLDENKLFETNRAESDALEIVPDSKSKLIVIYDAGKQQITMALETNLKNDEAMKFTRNYYFEVLNGKEIKFSGVHQE